MSITPTLLQSLCTGAAGRAQALPFADPLNRWLARFGMDNPARTAAFLAQVLYESAEFTRLREDTDYRNATALMKLFPHEFATQALAAHYAGRPEAIASRAYAGRDGNGDEPSGDGWRFRGGGLIQLTGRDNYRRAGAALGMDLLAHPERIAEPEAATATACLFWSLHHLNEPADAGDFHAITRAINGPACAGEAERERYWARAKQAFGLT